MNMSASALAYKKLLTLDEAAKLILDGGKGISAMWSLLREAVEDGSLAAVRLVRHSRYVVDMGCEIPDPTGHADKHRTIIERAALVAWLTAINFQPKPALLFPEHEAVAPSVKPPSIVGAGDTVVTQDKPLANWKMRVQAEAAKRWKEQRVMGCNPTRHSLKDELATWCRDTDVFTTGNINPCADYLYKHVLAKRHWTPPKDD